MLSISLFTKDQFIVGILFLNQLDEAGKLQVDGCVELQIMLTSFEQVDIVYAQVQLAHVDLVLKRQFSRSLVLIESSHNSIGWR